MTIVIDGTTGISGVDGTAASPAYEGSDTNTGIFFPAADTAAITTNGTERMRIDSSGNVGIGTSTNNVYDNVAAGRPLVVQSSSSATTAGSSTNAITISNSDTTTNNLSQLNFAAITGASASQYSAAWIACQYGARTNGQYPTGQLIFATSTTLNSAPSEKMRIDSSGNVGIGTSSPGVNLDVVGTTGVRVKYGAGSGLLISQASSGGSVAINNQANDALLFNTNNIERARIDTSGNLLVGRTNNPGSLSNSLYVTGAYSNTTPSGANVFVNTDGSFYRSTSSLKYKTDVQDYSRNLKDVAKLRPVFYKAKSGISTEQRFAGFIAEEIEAAGLTEFVQYAEDGSPDALSYGNMVALCIKAIQEQQAMIETLQAKVTALEVK